MKVRPAARAARMEYAIRDVVLPARELEKKGIDVIRMNIGDPDAFDFDTPEHIKRAMFDAVLDGYNGYGDSEGDVQLRGAIASRERRKNGKQAEIEDIIVTTGITEGIQLLLGALVEAGDELLVPGPTYPPYSSVTGFFGGVPVAYRTIEEEGWRPDVEDMRAKITPKTRAILTVSPNNPTGAVYSASDMKAICDMAAEHDLPLISDEIYDMLTYGVEHVSPATVSKDVPVITLNGFSKSYLVTGWRVGYVIFRDAGGKLTDLKEAFLREVRARLCASNPAQRAMIAALEGPQTHVQKMVRALKERRDYAVRRINAMDNLSVTSPDGAFYLFPKIEKGRWKSDLEFVLHVLREGHVLLVHGSGFDRQYGNMHFRSVFLPPMETLEKAMDGLEMALAVRP
ncbi:MAG: aminotransferase class I/II-fold pyridoxal phosphate-dependent enzyme [Thermoplasmata archaeon]|nr:aminotransferase class I/II-fold pyridoxal phosphate-dependent enzyme [Candidatus Sysuiplasma acidicola]MBX8645305.1 aminotransferase class I/II-fold pyridoxal phosphate-dependent enzyme [Candidatus Sysuiplasma acidicola]MDH2906217.1 aminotransferase class I/II-fold pyridoxal phosphate-dependent enzyme [Methanomassiliicoccales archaeon]